MYESVTLTLIFIDPNPYFYLIKIRVRVTLSYIRNYPFIWSEPCENEMRVVVLERKNVAAMETGAPHLL